MTPRPPEGAPNVLLVLIDDAGFGEPVDVRRAGVDADDDAGCRAGAHLQPLPRHGAVLADAGGAAHRPQPPPVGFGSIGELPGPFPGYTASVPKDCASFVRVLQGNGYSTGGFGKWHLTPDHVQGAAGPFDRWPTAWGFDRFWGFLGGEAGQYDPVITQDNTTDRRAGGSGRRVLPAGRPHRPGGALAARGARAGSGEALVHVLLDGLRARAAPGGGRVEREVPRQVRPGLGPAARGDVRAAEAARRDPARRGAHAAAGRATRPGTRSATTRRSCTRGRWRSIAGFEENADWNVGRLLDAIEEMGELDNTLVLYIFGDNGASLEGTITGSFNELTMQNGIALTPEQQLSLIEQYGGLDAWGTDAFAPHYATAWAWAGNTPFQWGKQVASHLGGTRNPMVVSWPERIKDAGDDPVAVHALHRHRPDDPRGGRAAGGEDRRRDRAEADGRHELPLQLRRRGRRGAAHGAVLRDLRQPRDLQGRLVGRVHARPDPVGRLAADDREVRAGHLRPRAGQRGSCTTCPTTSARRTTSRPSTPRSSPS